MTLVHNPDFKPTLCAPEVVLVPQGMSKEQAQQILATAARTAELVDDLAASLCAAFRLTSPWGGELIPDSTWITLARTAIARIEAAR